jgi:hypothetical protein
MSSRRQAQDELLIERFIESFQSLDDMMAHERLDPVAWQLATGESDQYGCRRWIPIKVDTEDSSLEPLYSKLPAKFPRLFERLVLSYRWAEVELDRYRLLANPPGPDLTGLLQQMSKDSYMWDCLIKAGFIQFARGSATDYDPVCFDISKRTQNRDYRVVKIDHEGILCRGQVKIVADMAPSFENLMLSTVDKAADSKGLRH